MRKLCSTVRLRVSKKLSTPDSLFGFIREMAVMSGVRYQLREGGILILESPPEAPNQPSTGVVEQTASGQTGEAEEAGGKTSVATAELGN